jgi:hypothetical protein
MGRVITLLVGPFAGRSGFWRYQNGGGIVFGYSQ